LRLIKGQYGLVNSATYPISTVSAIDVSNESTLLRKTAIEIEEDIDQERKQGRATYFGETLELLCHLQLQS